MDTRITIIQAEYDALPEKPFLTAVTPRTCWLQMSDGVRLRTVVYRPARAGPFPTILMRSCYPCDEPIYKIHGREYSKRGFCFVYQFCRGTGGSEGQWIPNIHERDDGMETMRWLASQPWAKRIGYFGCSYLALTGWVLADIKIEKFVTLYLTHYGTDRYVSAYTSGCFHQDVLTSWAMENAGRPVSADFVASAAFLPQEEVDEQLWGQRLNWYRDWITNTNPTDPYWNTGFWGMLRSIPARMTRPVFIGEGWYDHHLGSALQTWERLSPQSKAHSTLRIGAWNHDFQPCMPGVPTCHLENSDTAQAYNWFSRILRDNLLPETCIETYTIGEDAWHRQKRYPLPGKHRYRLFLSSDGRLTGTSPRDGSRTYVYDPGTPVPSHGGERLLYSWNRIGSLPQPAGDWRSDVLTYTSAELAVPVTLQGPVNVTLYVSSDAQDTAFTAKLMEVRPDGIAYHIRSGIATLASRNGGGREHREYRPGQIVPVTIQMWDIAWRLERGVRIRLDISSSDFPQFNVHTNYPGVWSRQKRYRLAAQSVYGGHRHPSHITLQVR